MGWNNEQKQDQARQWLANELVKSDILKVIIENVANGYDKWATECTGYYDSCKRRIIVKEDCFSIERYEVTNDYDEMVLSSMSIKYTDHGYRPLHALKGEKDKEILELCDVLEIWAKVIVENLKVNLPELKFSEVYNYGSQAVCKYKVAPLQWKDWF